MTKENNSSRIVGIFTFFLLAFLYFYAVSIQKYQNCFFSYRMSLYTKDFLLDGKIIYLQPKKGYRSGIEPIILAAQCKKKYLAR